MYGVVMGIVLIALICLCVVVFIVVKTPVPYPPYEKIDVEGPVFDHFDTIGLASHNPWPDNIKELKVLNDKLGDNIEAAKRA